MYRATALSVKSIVRINRIQEKLMHRIAVIYFSYIYNVEQDLEFEFQLNPIKKKGKEKG